MHIEGKRNYHNIFEPTFFSIEASDGSHVSFQPTRVMRGFEHHLLDFQSKKEMKTYKLTSGDGTISYHYIINPEIGAIIIPPNAIEMDFEKRNLGISEEIQKFFEFLAQRHGYRLLVGITPQSAAAFNQRVFTILRKVGYYMGPPTEKSEIYFGEHQSTYTGNGISEIGTQEEYMMPPTIH